MKFTKGHGTQNDFVVLPDVHIKRDLSVPAVQALCDRQRGLGADGVLRVTTVGAALEGAVLTEKPAGVSIEDWFMDYRNADGSIAEMCGNGVRVFAHYLRSVGLEHRDEFVVASLAGPRPVRINSWSQLTADITVDMGPVKEFGSGEATVGGRRFSGLAIDVGNPHLACVDPDLSTEQLRMLDVGAPVTFDEGLFPDGTNVEVLTAPADGAVYMRVHERGVGETRSCGTGTVAAAYAGLRHLGQETGELVVNIPGGQVRVTVTGESSFLRGPSMLLADGEISDEWWGGIGACG
ncbi:diaminopimelate epimerase [Mycobacteroides saopaulense]|uniref:Diaminopimelate epimerase n=1 Tax=Mycobacteroides saopaulense TaxID=1578165 RepID=A0A1S1JNY7_9MYCO|nr:diaminopimelate epimerase [Mycobacteroides saopaulense]ALR12300.1 diaminopimelate epimerase [Mycobacteroides saopaulense]OHT88039.1 diaminopimelate epimerase [Mycobacteroides saopaulense]OHU06380.1 diaminopimelate epimerase [Mycobacteroides saopaulense]ORB51667.1 diaminopimelate epimerase [Mycobacteroides saopaulense]